MTAELQKNFALGRVPECRCNVRVYPEASAHHVRAGRILQTRAAPVTAGAATIHTLVQEFSSTVRNKRTSGPGIRTDRGLPQSDDHEESSHFRSEATEVR
jgi:hypothetical protein